MRQRWMNRKRGMGMLKGSGWALVMLMMLSVWKMAASSEEEECENRWIHIRKLPSRFNLDLLANCSEYPMLDDLCPYLGNHGLGQKTHNRSRSWYRTDPSMLELVFHRRMLEYPCLTQDPLRANAIYLPYYAGLDAIRYLYGPESNFSALHGLHLFHFLQQDNPQIWARHMAHDHFLVMARPAWDFSQPLSNDPPIWGTSFLELPQFFNLTALTLEARAWPWQEHAVPYPTSFHPLNLGLLESWITRGRRSKRSILALFAGGGGGSSSPNIRRSIRSECENATSDPSYEKLCEIVDCSNGVCEHDPIRFMRPMLQASFCLQPPGDTPTRRSTFDAILAGCIPVFFEDLSAKSQYGWHLPENEFEDFSVFIPKEEVVFRGLRILNVLQRIPRAKVRSLRQRVLALIPNVLYRKHDSSPGLKAKKDAFDLAIDGTLDKIRSRVRELDFVI
ncbi:probable xyloglucan galactosyltransferase GT19 [Vigna unguiculata]|uniref:probable xyloglucan galactosyltransferase GT19 n=1 Tax=Vigna unguiculata TaxID=3917 RepID=UPI001017117E|nr:probable xyloglucan galactosyltransferase GT19 [Vigna unguiculata]XP_027920244.1 probable xyloglucan galactosyltransferase GT19 [Vigna unguiculata]